jgi:hypothetical protein
MARKRSAIPILIPEPITRILALHGPVNVSSGLGPGRVSASVSVAPFDDQLVLFFPHRAPFLAGLDRDPCVELNIQGGDTNYSVRIHGRAVDTGVAAGSERRLELVHWLPAGGTLQRYRAVELVPERIEYAYDEDDQRRYYQGVTAAAETPSPGARWARLCFDGVLIPLILAFPALFVWIAVYGWWYPLRYVALVVASIASYGLLAACRILYRVAAHRRWQQGKAARHYGNMLAEGLLPVRSALRMAWILGAVALVALASSVVGWCGELAGASLAASQLWYLVPLWVFRFMGDMGTKPSP